MPGIMMSQERVAGAATHRQIRRTWLRPVLCMASLLLAAVSHGQTDTPGSGTATHRVTESGAFTYTIPIVVPPGTAGVQPNLALTYSSQAGNGLLGMGWNLSGLSTIHRCPKTMVQDGAKETVTYTSADRYCLDGQRLVAVAGVYGADNTEYRTERESWARIRSIGSSGGGTGPESWKVWTRTGQILTYGATANARIEAVGLTPPGPVRAWAVDRIADTVGNYLTVSYDKDASNGGYAPTLIEYTLNDAAGTAKYASVSFVYESRNDVAPAWQAGVKVKTIKRLSRVKSWFGATAVRDYRLTYGESPTTKRSRIGEIKVCDGAGQQCQTAHSVQWQTPVAGFTSASKEAHLYSENYHAAWNYRGDFNGDGRTDIAAWVAGAGGTKVRMHLSTADGFGESDWNTELFSGTDAGWNMLGDFNGDGKTDIAAWLPGSGGAALRMHLSTGSGFTPVTWKASVYGGGDSGWNMVGDFDGDGRADIISWLSASQVQVNLSTGSGFTPTTWNAQLFAGNNPRWNFVGDFNGDGRSDIASWMSATKLRVHLSTGSGFTVHEWDAQLFAGTEPGWNYLGDFNGDGLTDIASWLNASTMKVHLSKGDSFQIEEWPAEIFGGGNPGWNYVGDFNGDGRTDIAAWASGTQLRMHLSTGTGFEKANWPATTFSGNDPGWNFTGDYNGDGVADMVSWVSASSVNRMASNAPFPDLVSAITNDLGATVGVTYSALTDAAVYTKDSDASYPEQDLQAPFQVVAGVSTSDGIGGTTTAGYVYRGARMHLLGGGWLGFRQVESTDSLGLKLTSTYRRLYPYQGLLVSAEKRRANATVLTRLDHTWLETALPPATGSGGAYHKAELQDAVELTNELDGTLVTKLTTTHGYDSYGNATSIVVKTAATASGPPDHTRTVSNNYLNNTTGDKWLLGRLLRSVVTSTKP